MSVDMANASHYDVGDCSQGICIWLEEMPGLATGWYFVMPNMYCCIDGRMYNGINICLCHGTAISWDGRVIRHGTSVSHHNGWNAQIIHINGGHFNHLYGTFTEAKERIVNAGRTRATNVTATPATVSMETVVDLDCDPDCDDSTPECELHNPTIKDSDPNVCPLPKDGIECE
jgi:hypothetical protein